MKQIACSALFVIFSLHNAACQNVNDDIKRLNQRLKSNEATVSQLLKDETYNALHAEPAFREMIRNNAKPESITIVSDKEPGIRITVEGELLDKKGQPKKNILVYFYQTSDKGWYAEKSVHIASYEGDYRHARLFGYLRTDDKGRFSINTIKPKGYPQSDLAAHIHIHFWDDNKIVRCPAELQFEDDPRMTPERKIRSLAEGFLISKNTGSDEKPVYAYKIICDE